jgi:predicted  nucleic acid-binding Zn-ribbon protein
MQSAHDCAEGECSIDDVSELIYELKEQKKEMTNRLEEIMNMVSHLQNLNTDKKRKTEDVRAYVKDLLRVFDTTKGRIASGFSGDIGDGPTDAYKALNPKPWKPKP